MFKKNKKNNKGFTLVELLVVIAIIGILAVVAVPSLMKNIDKAKTTQVMANISSIRTETLTEYANGGSDSVVAEKINTFISSITNKKFGEEYLATAGSNNIVISIDFDGNVDAASSVIEQLGTDAVVKDTDNKDIVLYTIGAR